MSIQFFIPAFILFCLGFFIILKSAIGTIRNFERNQDSLWLEFMEFVFIGVFPGIGIFFFNFQCDVHPFDPNAIASTFTLWVLFATAHFTSKYFKQNLSPLLLLLVSSAMFLGLVFSLVICIHFVGVGYAAIVPVFQLLFVTPLMCVLYLTREMYHLSKSLSQTFSGMVTGGVPSHQSDLFKWMEKYNLWFCLFLSAPVIVLIQATLYLVGQRPDSLITQFTASCGYLLSYKQDCSCGGDHYLCSVAANGSRPLVKPVRMGLRQNEKILVNRQLMIANAFENLLERNSPVLHKYIRGAYDKMEIPVNAWSKKKKLANLIYILMKPLEWFFLFCLYFFETDPESKIARQYLPKNELDNYINIHSYEKHQ